MAIKLRPSIELLIREQCLEVLGKSHPSYFYPSIIYYYMVVVAWSLSQLSLVRIDPTSSQSWHTGTNNHTHTLTFTPDMYVFGLGRKPGRDEHDLLQWGDSANRCTAVHYLHKLILVLHKDSREATKSKAHFRAKEDFNLHQWRILMYCLIRYCVALIMTSLLSWWAFLTVTLYWCYIKTSIQPMSGADLGGLCERMSDWSSKQ